MKIICNYEGKKVCNIYVASDNISFPYDDWDDFGLSIIGMWMGEIYEKVNKDPQNNNVSFELYFMDGPYYLKCYKRGETAIIMAIDDHDGTAVFNEECKYIDLLNELLTVAKSIKKIGYIDDRLEDDFNVLSYEIDLLEKGE